MTGAADVSFILGCLCLHDICHPIPADTLDMYIHEGVAFFLNPISINHVSLFSAD